MRRYTVNTPHLVHTNRGTVYIFTPKHHGTGPHSCWHPDLHEDDEFEVFHFAEREDIACEGGDLYGMLRKPFPDGPVTTIGSGGQQLAKFPKPNEGCGWHGYPVWPADDREDASDNRKGEKCRPSRVIFDRLLELGVINRGDMRQLKKGLAI